MAAITMTKAQHSCENAGRSRAGKLGSCPLFPIDASFFLLLFDLFSFLLQLVERESHKGEKRSVPELKRQIRGKTIQPKKIEKNLLGIKRIGILVNVNTCTCTVTGSNNCSRYRQMRGTLVGRKETGFKWTFLPTRCVASQLGHQVS